MSKQECPACGLDCGNNRPCIVCGSYHCCEDPHIFERYDLIMRMTDFTFVAIDRVHNLIAFNEIKGHWVYPKKGFIQWKNEK